MKTSCYFPWNRWGDGGHVHVTTLLIAMENSSAVQEVHWVVSCMVRMKVWSASMPGMLYYIHVNIVTCTEYLGLSQAWLPRQSEKVFLSFLPALQCPFWKKKQISGILQELRHVTLNFLPQFLHSSCFAPWHLTQKPEKNCPSFMWYLLQNIKF